MIETNPFNSANVTNLINRIEAGKSSTDASASKTKVNLNEVLLALRQKIEALEGIASSSSTNMVAIQDHQFPWHLHHRLALHGLLIQVGELAEWHKAWVCFPWLVIETAPNLPSVHLCGFSRRRPTH